MIVYMAMELFNNRTCNAISIVVFICYSIDLHFKVSVFSHCAAFLTLVSFFIAIRIRSSKEKYEAMYKAKKILTLNVISLAYYAMVLTFL